MTDAGASVLLPILIGLPILGAILCMLMPKDEENLVRGVALAMAIVTFAVSLAILGPFKSELEGWQLVFSKDWIPGLGSKFKLGIDGLSIWLVILTTFLMPIVLLSAHKAVEHRVREFCAILLVLEAGMLGAFLALDLFLFYVFWEVMLIPMYLLIGIWGGKRRLYASIKFVIYTMVGSLLMLVAIFYVYAQYGAITGEYTTDLAALDNLLLPRGAQVWCFSAFAVAFAIKVPLFPFHTWLPDAHVEAPTAGSVILAGVLLKFGVYGFLRFAMPMFPLGAAEVAPWMGYLAIAGIIYGAFVAFAQDDVKKLVAYSSVSHLGFCILGITALTVQGIEGSIYAMLSHGLTTSGLFLAIGVVYERRHTRRLDEYGGIAKRMPVFTALFMICMLGSAGLPGLSGFVGEYLTIFGTFIADKTFPEGWDNFLPYPKLAAGLAVTGVIFGAVYLLYMFQKMMFGPITNTKNEALKDVSAREIAVFAPLIVMIFVMGVFPRPFLKVMEPSTNKFIRDYKMRLAASMELGSEAIVQGYSPPEEEQPAADGDAGDEGSAGDEGTAGDEGDAEGDDNQPDAAETADEAEAAEAARKAAEEAAGKAAADGEAAADEAAVEGAVRGGVRPTGGRPAGAEGRPAGAERRPPRAEPPTPRPQPGGAPEGANQ